MRSDAPIKPIGLKSAQNRSHCQTKPRSGQVIPSPTATSTALPHTPEWVATQSPMGSIECFYSWSFCLHLLKMARRLEFSDNSAIQSHVDDLSKYTSPWATAEGPLPQQGTERRC